MYSMNTQWLRLDTAFMAVASHARASAARAISTAALSASVTGTRIAPCKAEAHVACADRNHFKIVESRKHAMLLAAQQ
jgi:hypothetical protein